ncbi:hypothetical protein AUI06_10175 [archaeon 13_2_20CM_2_52_21]|nr:MAG: hypothetical protein AUI06_10175 [archaeon 13_2_20CM_2_52_21]OLD44702.1 MAG: hypothetical protein AUI51_01125 [archaeon 13_1_40CM_2_52_4]
MKRELTAPAFCGIAAPIVMVSLWALASVLRPGYDQLTQKGSELGTGPNSIVMNANFVVTGLLILIFCFGLLKNIDAGKWSQIGLVFLAIAGVGEIATGIFPCDPGCPLTGSLSQLIHTGIVVVFFGSVGIFPLFTGIGLNLDKFWASYRSYSLVTGLASIGLFTAFSIAILTSFQYVGLLQRLFLAFPFQWIWIVAVLLRRRGRGAEG